MGGQVSLIGAGPGAADLLTLRAAQRLAQADIVFYDALVSAEIMALIPIETICVAVGKRCGKHSTAQQFINKQLIDAAAIHKHVVRLKGGDPMIFGRAQEEIEALKRANVSYEVIPGITTALAASASLGISLTQRDIARSVAFVTPRFGTDCSTSNKWLETTLASDTTVLYMSGHQLENIQQMLIKHGQCPNTPAVLLSNVSHSNEQRWAGSLDTIHLSPLPNNNPYPLILMLGKAFSHAYTQDIDATIPLEQRYA